MLRARALLDQTDSCLALLSSTRQLCHATIETPIKRLLPDPAGGYGDAIELHGTVGSGKTHILYLLVIEAVLAGKSVIVFDTDLKWDTSRLLHLLNTKTSERHSTVHTEIESLDLLDLVYIYQPQSAKGFLVDVQDTFKLCSEVIQNHAVRYIMVDSMSAFHWQYTVARDTSMIEVFKALRKLAEQVSAILVYSTWDLGFNYMTFPHSTRLAVNRKQVLQFTQGLDQAFETKEARMEVLNRGISYVTSVASNHRVAFRIQVDDCSFLDD